MFISLAMLNTDHRLICRPLFESDSCTNRSDGPKSIMASWKIPICSMNKLNRNEKRTKPWCIKENTPQSQHCEIFLGREKFPYTIMSSFPPLHCVTLQSVSTSDTNKFSLLISWRTGVIYKWRCNFECFDVSSHNDNNCGERWRDTKQFIIRLTAIVGWRL